MSTEHFLNEAGYFNTSSRWWAQDCGRTVARGDPDVLRDLWRAVEDGSFRRARQQRLAAAGRCVPRLRTRRS